MPISYDEDKERWFGHEITDAEAKELFQLGCGQVAEAFGIATAKTIIEDAQNYQRSMMGKTDKNPRVLN